ncbi:MAG: hypothetical protein Q4C70_05450 [Planctomycetia bacterium]|nr:hypothetical protein [Planctomycetia bacterium]
MAKSLSLRGLHSNQKLVDIPKPKDEYLVFSFKYFNREIEEFNLGGREEGTVKGLWWLSLVDALKSISNIKITELGNSTHRLHTAKAKHPNVQLRNLAEGDEYYELRINKGSGRIIGIMVQLACL